MNGTDGRMSGQDGSILLSPYAYKQNLGLITSCLGELRLITFASETISFFRFFFNFEISKFPNFDNFCSGNIVIETSFYDDNLLVSTSQVRVFYV